MKNTVKIIIISMMIIFAAAPVFSQNVTLKELDKSLGNFSEDFARALPFNSTIGLNWSDAYIGQLMSVPPHFGIGFSMGFTTVEMNSLGKLMRNFGAGSAYSDLPSMGGLPLPGYTIEARAGGLFVPFDVGLKFGYLAPNALESIFGVRVDYLLIGGDIRYAILDGKTLPVKLSVGLGYNYLHGGIATSIKTGRSFDFEDAGGTTRELNISDPKLGLEWNTKVLELKTQVSFPLLVITPYAGLGMSVAWSEAGYKVKADVDVDGNNVSGYKSELKKLGLNGISGNGFSSIQEYTTFNMRLYGGASLNVTAVKFDFTLMYNLLESNYGFTFGTRFQL